MCGIAGTFAISPDARVEPERVRQMTGLIRHRGPDGEGLWCDGSGRVVLGHRRLSVIDLATGQQPMVDPATQTALTFNGEIYNYIELRDRLRAEGKNFETQSDTEVLLRAWLRYGVACMDHLRGMFAFALWDAGARQLVLARDRIGKKPLYYAVEDGVLFFGSSFASVRSQLRSATAVDLEQVDTFLSLGYIPAPGTAHPMISKLPAGHLAIVSADGIELRQYWDPTSADEPFDGTWDQAVDELDEIINQAVAIRLRSDVPLGVFLSGGIDSSLVAAVAARIATTPVLTFSIGFDAPGFDERPHAEAVARCIGSEHRSFLTEFDALGLLPELVRHFGEPFGDQSAIPTWLLAEQTRRHVTVAVGGDGGDEGFGGYGWYGTAARLTRLRKLIPAPVARAGARALAASPAQAFAGLGRLSRGAALLARDEPDRYTGLRSLMDDSLANRLFAGALAIAHRNAAGQLDDYLATLFRTTPGSALRRMRVVDIRTYLADCLMPKVDVATMAHALEARAPLLDQEVIRFGLRLPDEWIRTEEGSKRILRAVLDRYVPARLFERPKQGFDMPLADWFNRQLQPRIRQLPKSGALLDSGWFTARGLESLLEEHASGRRDHSLRLYNLLVLEEWLTQN
jgi:asparagine synthase (glutamine-hydrolysing)